MSEEKSNIEKLGEDLKGVASDVANSEAVKAVKETLSEAAESEMAQKAKKKISEVANSEAAQKAKEKVSDAAKAAKEKLDELSEDARVKAAKAQALGYIAKAKVWIVDNWHAGRNGKLKVAAAFVIAFFVLKGILGFFGGRGTAERGVQVVHESHESDFADFKPETHLYACKYCGNQIRSASWPCGFKCPQRPQRPAGSARLPNLPCQWDRMD